MMVCASTMTGLARVSACLNTERNSRAPPVRPGLSTMTARHGEGSHGGREGIMGGRGVTIITTIGTLHGRLDRRGRQFDGAETLHGSLEGRRPRTSGPH